MDTYYFDAPDEQAAVESAVESLPSYVEFEVLGHTTKSGDRPGFYTVAAFETHEAYQAWLADRPDSGNDPENYPHSPGIIVIPTEGDISVLRGVLDDAYEDVRREYETHDPDDEETEAVRRGSLLQELLAQLRNVDSE